MRYFTLNVLDGIITAGTLTSGLWLRGIPLEFRTAISLSLIVATINTLTTLLAEYSHQRRELRELSYKLTLTQEDFLERTLLMKRAFLISIK